MVSGFCAGQLETPLGAMIAVVTNEGKLVRLDFIDDPYGIAWRKDRNDLYVVNTAVLHVEDEIRLYFDGKLSAFTLEIAPIGNAFLNSVWKRLRQVPYGTVTTYGDIARTMDPPTSARAIGRANALNPISIIVPCHRVVSADIKLTGYSGGLTRKLALLQIEGALASPLLI